MIRSASIRVCPPLLCHFCVTGAAGLDHGLALLCSGRATRPKVALGVA